MRLSFILPLVVMALARPAAAEFAVEEKPDRLVVTDDGGGVAHYVFGDESIRRPYWAHVHSPGGRLLTRRHPPVSGKDPTDHATMHPGIWLAFGEVSGEDFWRNKGLVRHERFTDGPTVQGEIRFTVQNSYVSAAGNVLAREICRYRLQRRPEAWLMLIDSTIVPAGEPVFFGDQEEMGLGVRIATELSVKSGGAIRNSAGGRNEKGTWGKVADWCDYSSQMGERRAGIVIFAHPDNFRASRWHSRDYGLLVANPFAIEAFRAGPKSGTRITRDAPLRLRFGVLLYETPGEPDIETEYRHFIAALR